MKKSRPISSKKPKSLHYDAIPYFFLALGFFGSALTTEAVNIMHEWAGLVGGTFYIFFQCFIVFVAWPAFMISFVRTINFLYEEKERKWWQFWKR